MVIFTEAPENCKADAGQGTEYSVSICGFETRYKIDGAIPTLLIHELGLEVTSKMQLGD